MSHNSIMELEISDLGALKIATERLGGEFIPNKKTYKWYGRFVNDYPLPEGLKVSDLGKCEHVIRFPGIEYEVGVIKSRTNPKNYELIYDFWDSRLKTKMGGVEGGFFKQVYGIERAKREAINRGKTLREITLKKEEHEKKGKMRLIINM